MRARKGIPRSRVAIGVRTHSGWAAYVALSGSTTSPEIISRGRIMLCDPDIAGAKQPFHEAEPMEFRAAERFISRCRVSSAALAERAFASIAAEIGRITACGLLMASGRPLPDLRSVLASHALIHAAEGLFYRDVIAAVCEHRNIALVRASKRDIGDAAERLPGNHADRQARLEAFGKAVGRPWTADEKLSAMAAWLAMASRPSGMTGRPQG